MASEAASSRRLIEWCRSPVTTSRRRARRYRGAQAPQYTDARYQRRVAPGSMPAVGDPERAATRGIDIDWHARRLQPGELRIEAADDEGDRTLLLPGAG